MSPRFIQTIRTHTSHRRCTHVMPKPFSCGLLVSTTATLPDYHRGWSANGKWILCTSIGFTTRGLATSRRPTEELVLQD
ncbi:hypothetical protein PMIN01_11491 [Paraphaeosphaeria minitans]|uniref:Uncharacterized protein n=1 Tax=Paraphaeosphaeria minitans TaxID=565426 RepID=A0A9P6G7N6_9PLEO|nr:hypothetical protein PMIN01_11491 [Paraphaeosphaeria minitans]